MPELDETRSESIDIKPRSRVVTDGIEATTSRGMLRAVGMVPQGVSNSYVQYARDHAPAFEQED